MGTHPLMLYDVSSILGLASESLGAGQGTPGLRGVTWGRSDTFHISSQGGVCRNGHLRDTEASLGTSRCCGFL